MIVQIYSVYDKKAAAYLQPFFIQNEGMAIRAVTEVVQEEGHAFNKHAQDYALYQLGTYDDSTGKITAKDNPHPIINFLEIQAGTQNG